MRVSLRTRTLFRRRRHPPAASHPTPDGPPPRKRSVRWRWQFSLSDLLAVMFVGAGGAVLANYLFRAVSGDNRLDRAVFVLVVTLGPIGMLALVRTISWLLSRQYPRTGQPTPPERFSGE